MFNVINLDDNRRPYINPNDGLPMEWYDRDEACHFAKYEREVSNERWVVVHAG